MAIVVTMIEEKRPILTPWSTRENRRLDDPPISALAIIETLVSMLACWWIVQWTGFWWLLVTSVLLAFLVNLRSPQSIQLGTDRFEAYWEKREVSLDQTLWLMLLAVGAGVFASYVLYETWLDPMPNRDWEWRLLVLFIPIFGSLLAAWKARSEKSDRQTALRTVDLSVTSASAVAASISLAVGIFLFDATDAEAVWFQRLFLAAAFAVLLWLLITALLTAINSIGLFLVILLRATFIRFLSTLRHPLPGISHFAKNWTHLALKNDIFTPPELLPGLEEGHSATISGYVNEMIKGKSLSRKFLGITGLAIFFLPSLIYKIYLKSTFWIYFPLVWVAHIPARSKGASEWLVWDQKQERTIAAWIKFFVSLLTIAGLFVWVIDWPKVFDAMNVAKQSQFPFHYFLLFTAIDTDFLQSGWSFSLYLIALGAAVSGVVAFYWTYRLHLKMQIEPNFVPGQFQIRALLILHNIKNLFSLAWITTGFYMLIFILHIQGRLPDWSQGWLDRLLNPNVHHF